MIIKTVRAGYKTWRSVKAGVDMCLHPVQWAKDQLIGALKAVLIAAVTKSMGGAAARALVEKLDLEGKTYPLSLSIPLPTKVRDIVLDPENMTLVQEVINDVLAIPLEVLGYRLAQVAFECSPDGKSFVVRSEIGLRRLGEAMVSKPEPVLLAKSNDGTTVAPLAS